MENAKRLDLVRGSLIGGAAGDALGYAVEFDSYRNILSRYGSRGITEYDLTNGVAKISDDTQMTLFLDQAFPDAVARQNELVERALSLADNDLPDVENIRKLGEGWVGEEALAIAVYAVARHIDSFSDTLIAAVNHNGDSDSTGAIAGNIIGAMVGYEAIPDRIKEHMELRDVILAIADDLHQGCIVGDDDEENTPEKIQWYERYCKMEPAGIELH